MKRVIIESPFAGNSKRNKTYARACLQDSIMRGESPLAFHMLYTQKGVLNDDDPTQRKLGMDAAFDWYECAHAVIVYEDLGVSNGMHDGIAHAKKLGIPIERRAIFDA
jgi:hypothetical protein